MDAQDPGQHGLTIDWIDETIRSHQQRATSFCTPPCRWTPDDPHGDDEEQHRRHLAEVIASGVVVPRPGSVDTETLAVLRDRFCDCPGVGLPDDQHSPEGCHGLEVARAALASGVVVPAAEPEHPEWQMLLAQVRAAAESNPNQPLTLSPGDVLGLIDRCRTAEPGGMREAIEALRDQIVGVRAADAPSVGCHWVIDRLNAVLADQPSAEPGGLREAVERALISTDDAPEPFNLGQQREAWLTGAVSVIKRVRAVLAAHSTEGGQDRG